MQPEFLDHFALIWIIYIRLYPCFEAWTTVLSMRKIPSSFQLTQEAFDFAATFVSKINELVLRGPLTKSDWGVWCEQNEKFIPHIPSDDIPTRLTYRGRALSYDYLWTWVFAVFLSNDIEFRHRLDLRNIFQPFTDNLDFQQYQRALYVCSPSTSARHHT